MANLNIKINDAKFNGGQINYNNPVNLKSVDYNMLVNAFAKQEQREEKANEAYATMQDAMNAAREQLHNDDATRTWFRDFANKYQKSIQDRINNGDYASALNAARKMAAEAAGNEELQARIKTNKQYDTWKDELDKSVKSGDIRRSTYNRMLAENPYVFKPRYDENGNVNGGEDFEPPKPVKHYDPNEIAATIFQLVSEESTSHARSSIAPIVTDENGKRITVKRFDNDKQWQVYGTTSSSSLTTTTQKTEEDLFKQTENILKTQVAYSDSLLQDYYDIEFEYKQYQDQADNESLSPDKRAEAQERANQLLAKISDANGNKYKPTEYGLAVMKPIIKELAYRRVSTERGSATQFYKESGAKAKTGLDEAQELEGSTTTTKGASGETGKDRNIIERVKAGFKGFFGSSTGGTNGETGGTIMDGNQISTLYP